MDTSSCVVLGLTFFPILISAASIGGGANNNQGLAQEVFNSFLGGESSHQHNVASSDTVCQTLLERLDVLKRSNAVTCKNFLDPKLIPGAGVSCLLLYIHFN